MSDVPRPHLVSILPQTLGARFRFRRSWLGICHRVALGAWSPSATLFRQGDVDLATEFLQPRDYLPCLATIPSTMGLTSAPIKRSARAASCIATPAPKSMTAANRPASEIWVLMDVVLPRGDRH